jgi:DNA transformation protein and related proteins
MAVTDGYMEFVRDLLSGFGPVTIKNMFGGAGLYADDGVMFAILVDDTLYLKADETPSRAFAAEGKGQFTYVSRGKAPVAMSYWEVPERLPDEPEELAAWARAAHTVARAAKSNAPPNRR